ncbi:MAG: DUF444 family protein [Clostridia bacterium]
MVRGEIPWDLRRRGPKDAQRHEARVREAIRKNLRHLIVEETIISSRGDRKVRVPVRYLDQYRFRYGRQVTEGAGHGPGEPGDIIARRGGQGSGGFAPGDAPGEDVYEAEVEVDDLVELMLEDLNLPRLAPAEAGGIDAEEIRFDDVRRRGLMNNLDKRRTLLQNVKRHAAKGEARIGAFDDSDLRFRVWNVRERPRARAAVYMLMDRSASMTTEKRYIAKSFYFWLTRFLRCKYREVDLVFISHDVEAQVVSEQEFFTVSSSGGTRCSSAYWLALRHIREYHPAAKWSNYAFHFSDGENLAADNERCGELMRQLLDVCRMVGYGEIRYGGWGSFYGSGGKEPRRPQSGLHAALARLEHPNLLLVCIDSRDEIYSALRAFLAQEQ